MGCERCVKKFLGGFKIQNLLSKVEKFQDILPIAELENVEKMNWIFFQDMRHMDFVFALQIAKIYCTTLQKLILGENIVSKNFEVALKSKKNFQNC